MQLFALNPWVKLNYRYRSNYKKKLFCSFNLEEVNYWRKIFMQQIFIQQIFIQQIFIQQIFKQKIFIQQIFIQKIFFVNPTRFCSKNSKINLDPEGIKWWGQISWDMTFNTILAQTMLADCIVYTVLGQFLWKQRETSIPFPSNWYLLWKWECYFFTAEKIDSFSNI